jgi:hypothetical protein
MPHITFESLKKLGLRAHRRGNLEAIRSCKKLCIAYARAPDANRLEAQRFYMTLKGWEEECLLQESTDPETPDTVESKTDGSPTEVLPVNLRHLLM